MWCLKRREDDRDYCVYILPNRKRCFGKTQSDIKLENDPTISRLHAIVSVELNEESGAQCRCIISDLSKYGTYILRAEKRTKVLTNEKFVLQVGDKVQFGLKNTIFIVTFHPLIITKSNLNEEELEKLKNIIKYLGGTLSENWRTSCTHLTVSERILLTTKLACALASAKPIVTIAYWEAIKNAVEEYKELPGTDRFLPTVKEEWLHASSEMFLPKEERKTLFHGLSFIHFCKHQYFMYAPLIMTAGGKSAVYPTKKPLTPKDLLAKNAIVIQQPVSDSTECTQVIATDYPIIYHKLNAFKRRMISDTEIPLAILNCSIEKYCNPKFDFGTFLKSSSQQKFSSSDVVTVVDTQDISLITDKRNIRNKKHLEIIPETYDTQSDSDSTEKTRFSNKTEKKDIPGTSKNERNIASNISSTEKICLSERKEKRNISGTRKNEIDIVNNISSNKNNRQLRIIPETYDSFDESIENDNSSEKNNEEPYIVPETCKESIASNFSMYKKPQEKDILQNVEFQRREEALVKKRGHSISEKDDNLTPKRNNLMLEKNKIIFEKNESTFEKDNTVSEKDNLVPTRTNLIRMNDATSENDLIDQNHRDENRKSSKGPRIISIEKVDNNDNREIRLEETSQKHYPEIEENMQLKKRKLHILSDLEKHQQEVMRTEEIEMEEKDKEVQMPPQRMTVDQYKKFRLDYKSMDQILRKDVPRGKIFAKIPALVPAKILRMDDFVLLRDTHRKTSV